VERLSLVGERRAAMGGNDERANEKEKLSKDLAFCESRLKEIKGKKPAGTLDKEVAEIEGELMSCKVELDELEGRSGDDWLDAKANITRRLEESQRNLQLTQRRMLNLIR